ncbi:autotransporter domain-containing protein [Candidatus Litorirhabdus singularis]|nr:autotransporter domain-containing protein [Candidatus Litorirhabdus singularis]
MHNAVALAGASLGATGAMGACPGNVTGTRTMACNLTGSDSVTVTSSGSIVVSSGPSAISVDSASTNVTITNEGTVSATSTTDASGIGVDGDFNGTINNSGTITGTVNGSTTASAAGIYIADDVTENSSITNSGTVTAEATASAGGAEAYGVDLDHDLEGTLTNTADGIIQGTATGQSATAHGVLVYYTMTPTGSITNNGTISGTANATTASAEAAGIYVDDYMEGTITNNGTITAEANGQTFASATGIYISSTMYSGSQITNSGTITAEATVVSGDAEATGIYIYDMEGASLTNTETGQINATASGESASATGVMVYYTIDDTSSITNHGTISGTANATTADAEAVGIYVDDYMEGSITNSGTISAEANGQTSASATGIYLSSTMYSGSQLTNSGTITSEATAVTGEAEAAGVYIYDMEGASFTNTETGLITATASGDYVSATGALVSGTMDMDSTLTNAGTITVLATAATESASAWGLYIDGDMQGTLSNDGTITVTANGATDAEAYGIDLDSGLEGTLSNSGILTVTANGTDDATAEGITIESSLADGSSLTNSGTITAAATVTEAGSYAEARGIYVETMLNASLTNTEAGTISATGSGASGEATGIEVDAMGADSSVVNAGTITVSMTSSTGEADAFGLHIDSAMEGTILNSSGISATAVAAGEAEAYGMLIHSTLAATGSVENSGSISVSASGGATTASAATMAAGIYVDSIEAGASVINSGTIVAAANGTMATAAGMRVDGYMEGSVSNTLDITVSGTGGAAVGGILIESTLAAAGAVENSGTISVTGSGSGNSSTAGIYVGQMESGASLSNSGSIIASSGEGAFSMYIDMGMGGNVSNSGRLEGDLNLNGTSLSNTGTVSIPAGVTGFVGGDYTQGTDGVLELGVLDASDGGYGKLTVAGTADLSASGELSLIVDPDDGLADQEVIQDVISAGTLITDTLTVTDDTTFWNFTAVNDGENNIDIEVERGLFVADAIIQTGPSWALGAAESLDVIIEDNPSGDMAAVIDELGSLETLEEVSAATAQLVPVLVGQSSQMVNLSLNLLTDATINRVAARQGMAAGDELMNGRNLWIRPFGSSGEQDDVGDVPGYDVDNHGLIIGYDQQINDSWLLGGAIGYSEAEVEDNSSLLNHELDVDSMQLSLYAEWNISDNVFMDFIGVAGSSESESKRRIRFAEIDRTAEGSYDSWYGRAFAGLGRDFRYDRLTVTPIISATYTTIDEDAYTEKNADSLNLAVDGNDLDALVLGLDGRVSYALDEQGSSISAHVGVGYDTMTDNVALSSTFVGGGPSFVTTGAEPEELILHAGIGVELHATDTVDIYLNYDYEDRSDFERMSMTATVRWAF